MGWGGWVGRVVGGDPQGGMRCEAMAKRQAPVPICLPAEIPCHNYQNNLHQNITFNTALSRSSVSRYKQSFPQAF